MFLLFSFSQSASPMTSADCFNFGRSAYLESDWVLTGIIADSDCFGCGVGLYSYCIDPVRSRRDILKSSYLYSSFLDEGSFDERESPTRPFQRLPQRHLGPFVVLYFQNRKL